MKGLLQNRHAFLSHFYIKRFISALITIDNNVNINNHFVTFKKWLYFLIISPILSCSSLKETRCKSKFLVKDDREEFHLLNPLFVMTCTFFLANNDVLFLFKLR